MADQQPMTARRGLPSWAVALIAAGAVVLIAAAVAVWVLAAGNPAAATTVRTEPIETAVDPFTPPVGDDVALTEPFEPDGARTAAPDEAGVFGGTLEQRCDPEQLVSYLAEDPALAEGWANTLGITPADIPEYAYDLRSTVLVSDTFVTNHGWSEGQVTSAPAVLQAGTAVMVDDKGAPAVKCYCGNPLTPPPPASKLRFEGPTWPGFKPGDHTVVVPSPSSSASDSQTGSNTPSESSSESPSNGSESPSNGSESPSNGSESPSNGSESPSNGGSPSDGASDQPTDGGSEQPTNGASGAPNNPSGQDQQGEPGGGESAGTVPGEGLQ